MGHPRRGLEGRCDGSYVGCGGSAPEVSEGNNIRDWARGHPCDNLVMSAFCPQPKNLPEVKLKSNGLISSAEKISRQPNDDSVVRLLVIIFKQVYDEKEHAGQREVQNVQPEEKTSRPVSSVHVHGFCFGSCFQVPALGSCLDFEDELCCKTTN